jgi:UDP-N-acetylmuramate dehydrogenase
VTIEFERDVPLAPLTTLGIGGRAKRFARVSVHDLTEVLAEDPNVLVIGEGSNLVVGDAGFDGTAIQLVDRDITRVFGDGLAVAAGIRWDDFVARMVEDGHGGIECLSGIPGCVGATPMQNVGAYGQEVSDTIRDVCVYDRERGALRFVTATECGFGYRTSKFRGSSRWIIVAVVFRLTESRDSMPIRYAELAKALGIREGERAPLKTVRDTVIALRRAKGMVIDPSDPESKSAGSFFTNPIVSSEQTPPDCPNWPQPDGRVKLAAAWLIERAGFSKGHTVGNVGISKKHALALVNRGGATAQELLALARSIQDAVRARFAIDLQLEPVVV